MRDLIRCPETRAMAVIVGGSLLCGFLFGYALGVA